MAYALFLYQDSKFVPDGNRVPLTPRQKIFCISDHLIISALLVIGILAIVGSSLGHGHVLHGIGTIGKIGGGIMVGIGGTWALVDMIAYEYNRSKPVLDVPLIK